MPFLGVDQAPGNRDGHAPCDCAVSNLQHFLGAKVLAQHASLIVLPSKIGAGGGPSSWTQLSSSGLGAGLELGQTDTLSLVGVVIALYLVRKSAELFCLNVRIELDV